MSVNNVIIESIKSWTQEAGFEKYPPGWDRDSVIKFARTIGGDPTERKWFDKCVNKIKDEMGNPEAFCASVKDEYYNSTYWRGKGKTKKEITKSIRMHKKIHKEK